MSHPNPHGFPGMREFLARDFQQRRAEALGKWRDTFPSHMAADVFLADWAAGIAEDEDRRAAAENVRRAGEVEAARHRLRTEEIPQAFLAAGAAQRDVRLWLSGERRETEAFRATRDLLAAPNGKPFLVLVGDVGTGKTCGATLALLDAAANAERWRPRDTPRFWNAAEVALGALLGPSGDERRVEATEAPVLVIEDLGAEPLVGADTWLSMLGVVIDARYRREALTIITTNLATEALKERYKARIVDRLRQCARFRSCGKDSMRKAAM